MHALLRPGDELLLHGGTYSQNSRRAVTAKGTPEQPIIIRAAAENVVSLIAIDDVVTIADHEAEDFTAAVLGDAGGDEAQPLGRASEESERCALCHECVRDDLRQVRPFGSRHPCCDLGAMQYRIPQAFQPCE